jgi:hypothetical protein
VTGSGFTYRAEEGQKARLLALVDELYAEHGTLDVAFTPRKHAYSASQRGALHLACENLATVLNDAGLDQKAVLKPGSKIPWSKTSVKDKLYKPVLEAMAGKQSTEAMTSEEPSVVWDALTRMMAEHFGVTVPPWPSRFGE